MQACRYCKDKHLRCDKRKPRCSRCKSAGLNCVRGDKEILPLIAYTTFEKTQQWVPIPPKVDFILDDLIQAKLESQKRSFSGKESQLTYTQQEHAPPLSSSISPVPSQSHSSPVTLHEGSILSDQKDVWSTSKYTSSSGPVDDDHLGHIRLDQEAELLRHYIDHVSCCFDVADAKCHFARDVPLRARENATLRNAIFALSAKHLSSTSNFDSHVSDRYLEACLETLIPALSDINTIADEAFFAAVIILRYLEELNVPFVGSDPQNHRVGTQAIIAAGHVKSWKSLEGLQRACYWTAFRQEFYVSTMTQRPMQWMIPDHIGMLEPADDYTWALRAVQQCGKVVNLVFNEDEVVPQDEYVVLLEEIEAWEKERPKSFDAFFVSRHADPNEFPLMYMYGECHVMGREYHLLAHTILVSHTPVRGIGPSRRRETLRIDMQLRDNVCKLYGIAVGNPKAPCAAFVACVAIDLVGDRINSSTQRQQLLSLLVDTEARHAWPTSHTQRRLKSLWKIE